MDIIDHGERACSPEARQALARIFSAAVDACAPARVLPRHLPPRPSGSTILIALGKAADGMAEIAARSMAGRVFGIATGPRGSAGGVEWIASGHPVPDRASVPAAERALALAASAQEDDLVLVLLSGGASAMACLPGEGLTLAEKRRITEDLLRSGAAIGEINCVRRHLSRIKGGRLARAAQPARLVTLAISDVPGDNPEDIGSGPTVADPSNLAEAQAIARRYGIEVPAGWSESLGPDEAACWRSDYRIVADAALALDAAAAEAKRLGYLPRLLGSCSGEAREVAAEHARLARRAPPGTALISGGELSVTVAGRGRGGRNQEYALALAGALNGAPGVLALAADSDGIDGPTAAAGAFVDPTTLTRARAVGIDPADALARNDSGSLFEALGDLHVTGPTGTNVGDVRVILVGDRA